MTTFENHKGETLVVRTEFTHSFKGKEDGISIAKLPTPDTIRPLKPTRQTRNSLI